jgi:hypothetical protein
MFKRVATSFAGMAIALMLTAATSHTVNYNTTATITEFSVCKTVKNLHATGLALFVPTNTSTEWSTFYGNPPAGVTVNTSGCVTPGNHDYTTAGTFTFTVPAFNTLTVQVWGGGGGGAGGNPSTPAATSGGQSSFNAALIANGGSPSTGASGAAGGTASGGTTNTTGGTGASSSSSAGGTCPASGPCHGGNGARWCPVTCSVTEGGGGSGGYSTKTYSAGQLTVGANVTVKVGAAGQGGTGTAADGGDGGAGRVYISWN